MSDLKEFLVRIVTYSQTILENGHVVLFIWRDEAHMNEWKTYACVKSQSIRIVKVNSEHLSELKVDGDRKKTAIAALAVGTSEDFADTRVLYHIGIQGENEVFG